MKLSEAKPGACGRVTALRGDARFLSRAISMGLTVGGPIAVLQNEKRQPVLVYSRDTMIALNRAECEKIEIGEGL